jgi:phage recombination protein Bet
VEEDLYDMSNELAVRGSTALTIADGQDGWTPQQLSTLQQLGVDGAGEGDLAVFFHQSVRTGLDPFARQIYMIARNERAQVNGEWTNVVKWTIQTGIDGYRLVARRAADRAGQQLTYEDTLWCGPDGNWRDVWLAQAPPLAAKVVVYRGAERFSAVAHWPEYVQTKRDGEPTAMWAKMGRNQLAKCAEALALRKAFPQDLSGIYTDDEMGQADSRAERLAEEEAARAERAARPAPARASRPAAQAPRVVQGEAGPAAPAAADAPAAPSRPAAAPAAAPVAEDAPGRDAAGWLSGIADAGNADEVRALWEEAGAAQQLDVDLEDDGGSFTVRERLIARVEQLQRDAGKPVAPSGDLLNAAPAGAGDGTAEAPLEGELLGAHQLTEPDPADLRRDTAQRRAVVSQLIEVFGGRDAMGAACTAEFGYASGDVGTSRLRGWLQRAQQAARAA